MIRYGVLEIMKARAPKYSKLQFVSSLLGMSIRNKWTQAKELQPMLQLNREFQEFRNWISPFGNGLFTARHPIKQLISTSWKQKPFRSLARKLTERRSDCNDNPIILSSPSHFTRLRDPVEPVFTSLLVCQGGEESGGSIRRKICGA